MSALIVLRGARELLSDPSRWTQCAGARDSKGNPVRALDDDAVCFCLYGAATKFVGADDERVGEFARVLRELDPGLTHGAPSVWQDMATTTHAMVLDLLDRAIAQEAGRA